MITESAAPLLPSPPPVPSSPPLPPHRESDKGLRAESVGLFTMISLGLASVAPAYSLTVTLGLVVAIVGVHAPAALLVGFVPILCTSFAYREQNRVMPDCGTNFVWITRTFGPWAGWLAGNWVPQIATLIAMTALNPDYGSTSIDGVGGVFLLGMGSIVLGLLVIAVLRIYFPDFFRHGRSTITNLIVED